MAEHDNAGFPLLYCLLSTATAIDRKRTKALTAWTKCLIVKYGVNPTFVHVNKDMAEIGMAKVVWNAKISLCWWHLRRAVRTPLANGKLSTTPYNVARAHAEFSFIDPNFKPKGRADRSEYEGGEHADNDSCQDIPTTTSQSLNMFSIRIPRQRISRVQLASLIAPAQVGKENRINLSTLVKTKTGKEQKFTIHLLGPRKEQLKDGNPAVAAEAGKGMESDDEIDADEPAKRRTFCPAIHRDNIINMMEAHYCAHPLIPGYAPPTPEGIRKWAVKKIYKYCFNNELPEVWAYLWENWYRTGKWELWARSTHPMIPILKTTLILESQYVSLSAPKV